MIAWTLSIFVRGDIGNEAQRKMNNTKCVLQVSMQPNAYTARFDQQAQLFASPFICVGVRLKSSLP